MILTKLHRDYLKKKNKAREESPKFATDSESFEVPSLFALEDLKTYVDEILHDCLAYCDKHQQDIITLLTSLIEELVQIDKEIYFNNLIIYKDHAKQFDFTKVNTMDIFLSQILFETFDYVLRYQRDFLKNLSESQVHQISSSLLFLLK